MLCAIQTPASQLHLCTHLSLGEVSLVLGRGGCGEEWCEALRRVVERSLQWDAVEAQTLWLFVTAELSCRPTQQLEVSPSFPSGCALLLHRVALCVLECVFELLQIPSVCVCRCV